MTTATGAYAVIRARLEASVPVDSGGNPLVLRWQAEPGEPLPDEPAPFIYTEFLADPSSLASFGGGRAQNRYRNPATVDFYVFIPNDWGLQEVTNIAEQVATLFRSYRDNDISCFDATVYPGGSGASIKPPGMDSEVGNYFYATVQVSLFFDLIG